jgi:hypothetical protein
MYPTELNAQKHHSEPDFPEYVKHLAEHLRRDAAYYGKRDYCPSRQHDPSLYDGDAYAELKDRQPRSYMPAQPSSPQPLLRVDLEFATGEMVFQ